MNFLVKKLSNPLPRKMFLQVENLVVTLGVLNRNFSALKRVIGKKLRNKLLKEDTQRCTIVVDCAKHRVSHCNA